MTDIIFLDRHIGSSIKENADIQQRFDSLKFKLQSRSDVKAGTGSIAFGNGGYDRTKFEFIGDANTSSYSNKNWLDLLNMEFPDYMGGWLKYVN